MTHKVLINEEEPDLDGLTCGEVVIFAEYVNVDENLQCMPMPTLDMINELEACALDLDISNTSDDVGDPLPVVTYNQSFQAYQDIQAFLLYKSDDPTSTYQLLNRLESAIEEHH